MATIAFDGRVLSERGTSVAVYDFADGAERQLGHRSIIFHQTGTDAYNPRIVDLFGSRFEPVPYVDFEDLKRKVRASGADIFYGFNFAPNDDRLVPGVKNALHVLFQHYNPQGEVYAYISRWMAEHVTQGRQPWTPLIVNLPAPEADLRAAWGFPADAVVLGRHGGYDQFDLPFVKGAVAAALGRRRDLHFAFLNTEPFIQHERVRFLPPVYDLTAKSNFIASCDGMLHGRKAGEGFGLAVAEFLALDKPVITWKGGKDRNHLHLIPDHSLVYRTAKDLVRILTEFQPGPSDGRFKAAVADLAPAAVMRRFQAVFVDGPGEAAARRPPSLPFRIKSKLETRAVVLRGRLWRDRGLRELKALEAAA
ncbi:MAG: hypothetical protein JO303_00865 [Caulobacteraceae bacterium]|nr:hypothetical protein [Caulobacteraceae bacterium]